jgi:hypothetical protein
MAGSIVQSSLSEAFSRIASNALTVAVFAAVGGADSSSDSRMRSSVSP